MKYATVIDGVIVGGVFAARQDPAQAELADNDPMVIAFLSSLPITGNDAAIETYAKAAAQELIELLGTPEGRALRAIIVLTTKQLNLLRKQVIGRVVATWDPASLANNAGASSPPVTVPGALFGDIVEVGASQGLVGWFVQGWVTAANTVVVRIHNLTGGTVNLPAIQWTVVVRRPEVLAPLEKPDVIAAVLFEITGDA